MFQALMFSGAMFANNSGKNYEVFMRLVTVLILFFIGVNSSSAASVSYEITNILGSRWQYNYSVYNNSLANDIEEFLIFFDHNAYANLTVGGTPINWDPLVIQPDALLPDDGYFDVLALGSGIVPGTSLPGFLIEFDYLFSGTPGSQYFEVRDSITFDLLETGNTVLTNGSVPEPNSIFLLIIGFVPLFYRISTKGK
ncbi:hypothetical protein [Methylomonas koyamae]|uniref:hypothetical protein n=1 Tax=Methylomonas koyamae TaxID=702114 RepID=UPI0007C90735|nr:hypothetical protein [Methylomonas koyamae]